MNDNMIEDDEIDIGQVFLLPVKKFIIIFVIALFVGAGAFIYVTGYVAKTYTSVATIYMQNQSNENATSSSDLTAAGYFANDAKVMITSDAVLSQTIEELGLDFSVEKLQKMITVEIPTNTRWLNITVVDTDPERAADIVNKVAEISSDNIVSIMGAKKADVVDKGKVPEKASGPNVKKWVIIAFGGALLLTYGFFVVLNLLDDKIHTADDVTKYLELPVLASIPVEDISQ